MNAELEDLVRATLSERAPSTAHPADWAALRARARRRTVAGRSTAMLGAAALGTVALTTPWSPAATTTRPATSVQPPAVSAIPPSADASRDALREALAEQTRAVAAAKMAVARMPERTGRPAWSIGPATDETVLEAMTAFEMSGRTSGRITDPLAQPVVIWSSAGGAQGSGQGPQVLLALDQGDGWVIGLWDQLGEDSTFGGDRSLGDCQWTEPMALGTMTAGPLDERFVGIALPCGDAQVPHATQIFYVAPADATRVVRVATEDPATTGIPLGTESEISNSFGNYGFSDAATLRAYDADGDLLDEATFGD